MVIILVLNLGTISQLKRNSVEISFNRLTACQSNENLANEANSKMLVDRCAGYSYRAANVLYLN